MGSAQGYSVFFQPTHLRIEYILYGKLCFGGFACLSYLDPYLLTVCNVYLLDPT